MELHIHISAEPPPSKHMNNKKKKKCVHGIIFLRLNDWMLFTFTCLGEERVYDNNNNIRGNVCSSLTPWNILQLLCSVHCVKRIFMWKSGKPIIMMRRMETMELFWLLCCWEAAHSLGGRVPISRVKRLWFGKGVCVILLMVSRAIKYWHNFNLKLIKKD